MFFQCASAVRRIAQPESLLCCGTQAAFAQITPRFRTARTLQLLLKPLRCHFHDIKQARLFALALFSLRITRGHGNTGERSDLLDSFGKTQAFKLGEEPEMITETPQPKQ